MKKDFKILLDAIDSADTVAFLTGAGVSTLCGIPDFRGPDGIYKNEEWAHLFDIEQFDADPSFFYTHAEGLVYGADEIQPGPVHNALVELQRVGKCAGVITQNIDRLHERAGSDPVFAVHGSATLHHCRRCNSKYTFEEVRLLRDKQTKIVPKCLRCGGTLKPDIVFFGESLPEAELNGAISLASQADLMIVLGSSLYVHPACSIPRYTLDNGGKIAVINRGATPLDKLAFFKGEELSDFANAVFVYTSH